MDYSIYRVPVCLSLRRNWVLPLPPSPASVSPPWTQMEEEQQSLEGEWVGDPIRTTGKKAWHSVYSATTAQRRGSLYLCSSCRFLKQRSLLWFGKNAAHTYDGPRIFRKRKNVVCVKFLHRLVCKDFYWGIFEILIPFLQRKLSDILYCRILCYWYNCWLFEGLVEMLQL